MYSIALLHILWYMILMTNFTVALGEICSIWTTLVRLFALRLFISAGGIRVAGWHEHHGLRPHLPGQERDREWNQRWNLLLRMMELNCFAVTIFRRHKWEEWICPNHLFIRGSNLSYELIFLNVRLTKFDYACKSLSTAAHFEEIMH